MFQLKKPDQISLSIKLEKAQITISEQIFPVLIFILHLFRQLVSEKKSKKTMAKPPVRLYNSDIDWRAVDCIGKYYLLT